MLLASCGHPAALREPDPHPTPVCLSIAATTPDAQGYAIQTLARVCFDRDTTCELVRDRAVRYAGLAGITTVGECKEER